MIDSQFNCTESANNIYLKWINITINKKFYRKYEMDYNEESTAGVLSSIYEYTPDNFQNPILSETIKNIQEVLKITGDADNNEFTFPDYNENFFEMQSLPHGNIDVMNYYSAFNDCENMEIPSVSSKELNSNPWSFHLIDFSGTDNTGIPGQYFYNWLKNRAFLSFNQLMPDILTTLLIILLRYHKNLYQLITEINLFMADNAVKYTNNKYYNIYKKFQSFI